jgi:hypothetical protein
MNVKHMSLTLYLLSLDQVSGEDARKQACKRILYISCTERLPYHEQGRCDVVDSREISSRVRIRRCKPLSQGLEVEKA